MIKKNHEYFVTFLNIEKIKKTKIITDKTLKDAIKKCRTDNQIKELVNIQRIPNGM
jgi:hypothetical protein